jgi:large subunit ribosomal protein L28
MVKNINCSKFVIQKGHSDYIFKVSLIIAVPFQIFAVPFLGGKRYWDMARVCEITGKRPRVGNKVSHANNKTKRRFYPNLQTKRFFIPEEGKWITLKISTKAIKTINARGITSVLKEAREKGMYTR